MLSTVYSHFAILCKCDFTGFAEHVLAEYLCISQPGKPNIENGLATFSFELECSLRSRTLSRFLAPRHSRIQ